MPLYYFNHQTDNQLLTDDEGEEFKNLELVREEAVRAARELIAEAARAGRDARHDSFEVTNDDGATVLRLKFADALDTGSDT
jgi:hypothetical protein